MKLYAKIRIELDDYEEEYRMFVTHLSITPFETECYYIDLKENDVISTEDYYWKDFKWLPYTVHHQISCCIDKDGNYLDRDEYQDDFYIWGFKWQEYKDGEPVGDPYFEEL